MKVKASCTKMSIHFGQSKSNVDISLPFFRWEATRSIHRFPCISDSTLRYLMDGWICHVPLLIHTILKDAKRKDSSNALLLDADRSKQNFARFGSKPQLRDKSHSWSPPVMLLVEWVLQVAFCLTLLLKHYSSVWPCFMYLVVIAGRHLYHAFNSKYKCN